MDDETRQLLQGMNMDSADSTGRNTATAEFVQKYGKTIAGYVRHVLGDRQDWEVAFNETVIAVLKKANWLARNCTNFPGWLHRVARNKAFDVQRERGLPQADDVGFLDNLPDPLPDSQEQAANRELLTVIRDEVAVMTPEDRQIFQLWYDEEMTANEIAAVTGYSPEAVRKRLHRIRQRLWAKCNPTLHTTPTPPRS